MEPYEKLGAFYLGRSYDIDAGQVTNELTLYDSRDLLTHAFCVGMTGSGKTGLCVTLIEEAAIDGIPALVIDPKGDLANLMLTFPDLRAEDFKEWIDEQQAERQGISPDEYARSQARLWRDGLESWGQTGERIGRLQNAAEFTVFTPGSEAGVPVSILESLSAPPPAIRADTDLFNERIGTTATSLLNLLGVNADPLKSREHILLSKILDESWRGGSDLDLPGLIRAIEKPPFSRVGILDLDTFLPADARFELAATFNNLLASPGFEAWRTGVPIDIDRLLYTPSGKPRISIFSVAHLSDNERMFFVSLLLNETLGWVRSRPGTTSLRAIVYMDEIFGFIPPVADPPAKRPLLTLLKQARAYGVGIVLATQNPVDLDYKALSNTGTWFIGRLQTDRDRARVLDGLEGASAGTRRGFDRAKTDRIIAGIGKRVFLMHNIH
ncbi:MAG: ATP-binding protein, partial [bacterium]